MNLHEGPRAAPLRGGRRVLLLVVGMVLAGVALAGCGAGSAATAPATSSHSSLGTVATGPGGVQEVTIQTQDDYVFTPNHITVHPGEVKLTVTNVGRQLSHNFRFVPGKGPAPIGAQILLLASGQKQTIDFTMTTPGTYQFECSFHADLGQFGTMTVTG
jgi:plastocyanin